METIKPIERICKKCGVKFLTKDVDETICLGCKIIEEMKLPENTIINQNVLNIYMAKKFDSQKGVDPYYLMIAEGVKLLNQSHSDDRLCSKIKFIGEKENSEIEHYLKTGLKNGSFKKKGYDALVFIKVNSHSKFMFFGLKYSDRLYNKLKDKDELFKKNYAISLVVNWMYRDSNK